MGEECGSIYLGDQKILEDRMGIIEQYLKQGIVRQHGDRYILTPEGERFYEQNFKGIPEQKAEEYKAKAANYWKKQEQEEDGKPPEAKKIETLAEYLSVDPGEIEIPPQRAGDNRLDWRGEEYLVIGKEELKKFKYLNGHIIYRING